MTFAIIGTTLSALLIGALMYSAVQLISNRASFTFLDTLYSTYNKLFLPFLLLFLLFRYFGALISPTDPLTILAIFSEKNVDVNLYALVFGESVLSKNFLVFFLKSES